MAHAKVREVMIVRGACVSQHVWGAVSGSSSVRNLIDTTK